MDEQALVGAKLPLSHHVARQFLSFGAGTPQPQP
jgi:hypothetical protein